MKNIAEMSDVTFERPNIKIFSSSGKCVSVVLVSDITFSEVFILIFSMIPPNSIQQIFL
jgi:hypothetical protein